MIGISAAIRNVKHLVWWGRFGFVLSFFFFLKGCEDNLALVQLPESRLCLGFISLVPAAGHFLRVAVIHRTPGLGN